MGEQTPKKFDPGWNDPPMLNYDCSNPPPKSRIGHKRVPFPLNSSSTSTQNTTNDVSERWCKEKVLTDITAALDCILIARKHADEVEELKPKIERLVEDWRQEKIDVNTQKLVFNIIDCISKGNVAKAGEYQIQLMMGNTSNYSSWIDGVQDLMRLHR